MIEASTQQAVDLSYELRDNRTSRSGRIFLTGTQALVRLLIAQRQVDQRHGRSTAGFVSGYRGSPLASLDSELWRAQHELDAHDIHFLPAINEDLAATAVMGTQQVGSDPERTVDGVFAMWYGKGPGLDRAGDALRHGNAAGTSPLGGVLMVVGDDHAATSSSIPNASEHSLVGWGIPVVNPSSVEEYEEFGLWGWALSRHSSTWVALKAISETVESGRSLAVRALPDFQEPSREADAPALEFRTSDFLTPAVEERLAAKLEAVKAFAALNSIDRLVIPAPGATIGIVAVGKAFGDLMEALARAGLEHEHLESLAIRIYKPGLSYPLDAGRAADFCKGLRHVLVIEEKAGIVEQQLKDLLFHLEGRPAIVGKHDAAGHELVTWLAQLDSARIAQALRTWLAPHAPDLAGRFEPWKLGRPQREATEVDALRRLPYFCSGCPHNTSTQVPRGSRAQAGVGCHYMASWMDRNTSGLVQMGAEGVDWLGHAPFTRERHLFQNMGEGTYFHSGVLAIRQAIAAGATITYKLLFNDAVAMTGGQRVDGKLSVPDLCAQLRGEGVVEVVVVTDDPSRYRGITLPPDVAVHNRRNLDVIQRHLREVAGVTVLVYDQTCAAEKRRRRRKATYPDPAKRLYIEPSVCEGCGDCGAKSNCVSITPLETEFGRKRQIDQSSCNKDYACGEGFCPSFVTVLGGHVRAGPSEEVPGAGDFANLAAELPEPESVDLASPYNLLIAGVGGTGVITLGAIISMAAHLEGLETTLLDFTALAQKGGSVVSHVRIASRGTSLHTTRVQWQTASALILGDMVVGALPDVLDTVRQGHTKAVVNTHLQTLAEFTREPDLVDPAPVLLRKIRRAVGDSHVFDFDAHRLATTTFGNAMSANMMLLGVAWQRGLVPLRREAIVRAIELNGVAVEDNLLAFSAGRLLANDANSNRTAATPAETVVRISPLQSTRRMIALRAEHLRAYQSKRYAQDYVSFLREVESAESAVQSAASTLPLTRAVALALFRLMAYKDEYEVARLYSRPEFLTGLQAKFDGDFRLRFHLAPPLVARRDAQGQLQKAEYGAWVLSLFRVLAALRFLRGTWFDPFGYTAERRQERKLIRDYRELVRRLLVDLDPARASRALHIASLASGIRGYGHVKEQSIDAYHAALRKAISDQGEAPVAPLQKLSA